MTPLPTALPLPSLVPSQLRRKPPLWLSAAVTFAAILLFVYLRVVLFPSYIISIGYGLPLLVALWHRNRLQLYIMALAFTILSYAKLFLFLLPSANATHIADINFVMSMVTTWSVTFAIHVALHAIDKIAVQNETLVQSNAELEAANEELATREEEISRQNTELQSQTEELERQHEELHQQAEELEQQTVELNAANDELVRREKGLHTLLDSARWLRPDLSERDVLSAVCQAAVQVMEDPVVAAAIVQEKDGLLSLRGHHGFGPEGALHQQCDYANSFAPLIVEKAQTGCIGDLHDRPDIRLLQPAMGKPFRSILATPLFVQGRPIGVFEVYAQEPREWSESEFKVIEWLAVQCAVALQAMEYQQEVLIKRREAEEASIQKTRFLAAVSHDVRTPANAVSLLADLIESAANSPDGSTELPTLAHDLKSSARALVELVSDVLDLARLDTGKLDLQLSEFSLSSLLRNELKQFERIAGEKAVRLSLESSLQEIHLKTDRMKLARVLQNLIGNAVKFTETGSIDILCSPTPATGGIEVKVVDTGVGIPHDALARIFDEFFQIRNPERDRNKGSGLGLAICKRLVEALGCSLSVESMPGVGTTFSLKIPEELLIESTLALSAPADDAVDANDEFPLAGLNILLIEDHDVTRKSAARLLACKGATVHQAANGRDGMHSLLHDHPHVILLDLMLPDLDGTQILRQISTQRPASLKCVLAVSGDVRDSRIAEVKALGADDLLAKPIDIQRLLNAIKSVLTAHAAPQRTEIRLPDASL